MSCLPCFQSKKVDEPPEDLPVARSANAVSSSPRFENKGKASDEKADEDSNINAKTFTFRELASATKNFRQECLIGEGGFGRVFRGTLEGGEVVAVKQLDRSGTQGNKEFQVEVLMLSLLNHPNLVNLIGYCADGDQRILVYQYMPMGCLADHVIDVKKPLDWQNRMKIAWGAAQGLEYLHEKANPPIIYRDLRTTNILLDEHFNPGLSDYGLAKLAGHVGINTCAPEYERSGELSFKSDIYSFGVVLLELITGRRAVDTTRPAEEQNLVSWAQPIFRNPKRFTEMADPLLENKFPERSLNQAVGVAAMCLQQEPSVRPLITDVVAALASLHVHQLHDRPSSDYGYATTSGSEDESKNSASKSRMSKPPSPTITSTSPLNHQSFGAYSSDESDSQVDVYKHQTKS